MVEKNIDQHQTDNSAEHKKPEFVSRLRGDLRIYPSEPDMDGNDTWTLFDPVTDHYFKLDAADYMILSRMNRIQKMQDLLDRLKDSGSESSVENIKKFIYFLSANGLIEHNSGIDALLGKQAERIKNALLSKWLISAYLFLDIPIIRPDRFFTKTAPHVIKFMNKWVLGFLILISLTGYLSILPMLETLAHSFWESLDFHGFLRYILAILLVKIVHETAHAYAAKNYGIRVRRMGVAFIVFTPRLYTDLTDVWRIPNRFRRAVIDGAGIASELVIGGFAAIVWSCTAPGITNTIAFYLFTVSAINTVFINGNPFIKYDGYYLLMDLVGIDNLYGRGVELLRKKFRYFVLGMPQPETPRGYRITGWRSTFMGCYSVLSTVYRIFLYTSIILIVYLEFTKFLGIMLFILELYLMIMRPLIYEVKDILRHKDSIDKHKAKISLWISGAILFLFFLPLPWNIQMNCEVKPLHFQTVYAKEDGILKALNVPDGGSARKGDVIIQQENPIMAWSISEWTLQCEFLERELEQIKVSKKRLMEQEIQSKRLENAEKSLDELKRRSALLAISASCNGRFVLFDTHLKAGKWLVSGEPIGELFDPSAAVAEAYVQESDVAMIKTGDKAVVTCNETLQKFSGHVMMVDAVPFQTTNAFSPLLDIAGGPIQTVSSTDGQGVQLQAPLYMIKIELDKNSDFPLGRTGVADIRKYQSAGGALLRKILSVLQNELSF